MNGLWSRTVRWQSKCHCVSCLSTASNAVASRASTAASRRRVRLGNSVTALYSSIFAAAALADARVKDNRRREWTEKIAAVKEEVCELLQEEKRMTESLLSQGSTKSGLFSKTSQTRAFTTTAPQSSQTVLEKYGSSLVDSHLTSKTDYEPPNNLSVDDELENSLFDYAEKGDETATEYVAQEWPSWATGDILRIKAIQKLATKQLAIRFLLWPTVAHNYSGVPKHYDEDFSFAEVKPEDLLNELHLIGRRIAVLKNHEDAPYDDLVRDITMQQYHHLKVQQCELEDQLQNDINLYLARHMGLPELLTRLAHNLMKSDDPDRPRAFRSMIFAFTKSRQNDLVDLTLRSLLPNRFELTHPLIVTILTFFRKSKNLKDFDLFLHMLRGEGYPLNLKSTILFVKKVVNGVEITVPPQASANPVLYNTMITAALCFDQPDRAQAWQAAWRATGFADDYSTLCGFLRFYSIKKDWENGLYTILRALAFITSTSHHNEKLIGRLILHMIHFCESCEMQELANAVAEAASRCGFGWEDVYRQSDALTDLARSFERWEGIQTAAGSVAQAVRFQNTGQKCFAFSTALTDVFEASVDAPKDIEFSTSRTGTLTTSTILHQPSNLEEDREDCLKTDKAEGTKSKFPTSHPYQEIASLREEVAQLRSLVTGFASDTFRDTEYNKPPLLEPSPSNISKVRITSTTSLASYLSEKQLPSNLLGPTLRKGNIFDGVKKTGAAPETTRSYSEGRTGRHRAYEDPQRHVIVKVVTSST